MNNMIKHISSILLFAICGVTVFSCSDDDKIDPGLTATPTELTVAYTGLTQDEHKEINFVITSNSKWEVVSDNDWIIPNQTSGEGTHTIFLKVGENGIEADREGSVTVRSGNLSETVVVKQLKKVEELTIAPKEITILKNGLLESGEKALLSLATNSPWTAKSNVSWVKLSKESGSEAYPVITLEIETSDGNLREGELTIVSGNLTEKVKVIQLAQRLEVTPVKIDVNEHGFIAAGTPPTLSIVSDEGWQITHIPTWVQAGKMSGTGDEQILLSVDQNIVTSDREDKITVTSGLISINIAIKQEAKSIPLPDDGKAIGYTYLNEDFAWITNAYVDSGGKAIPDFMGDYEQSTTPTIANVLGVAGNSALKQKWETQGWTPYIKSGVTVSVYVIVGALKFGTSTRGGGIISPTFGIEADKYSNITLSFDLANNIAVNDKSPSSPGYGTGTPDNPYVTVDIVGAGKFEGNTTSMDFNVDNSKWNDWQSQSVVVKGIGSDTQFIFRSQNMDNGTGRSRWYIDNVKAVKQSLTQ